MASPSGDQLSYSPSSQEEQAYYRSLFAAADVQRVGRIGGPEAVAFFSRSGLPVEALKDVWALADKPSTNSLDPAKFAVAVRLIQLLQNGQKGDGPLLSAPSGVALKPAFFEGVSGVTVPIPSHGGSTIEQHQLTSQTPPRPPVDHSRTVHAPPAVSILAAQDPYTMSPSEQARYEGIFPEYSREGFVYGKEAVDLFSKSGMSRGDLAAVWNMADSPVDNRLDKLEFAIAMHLIVCVTKKKLTMPPQLPASLRQLKSQKIVPDDTPGNMPQQEASRSVASSPGPPETIQTTPQPPPSIVSATLSISDAFEGLTTENPGPVSMSSAPFKPAGSFAPGEIANPNPQKAAAMTVDSDFPHSVGGDNIPSTIETGGANAPHTEAPHVLSRQIDSEVNEVSSLKSQLQKLQAENISLKAQLKGLSQEEGEVQRELGSTLSEVVRLTSELTDLRAQVVASKSRLAEASAELKGALEKKNFLSSMVNDTMEMKNSIDDAREKIESMGSQLVASASADTTTPAPAPSSVFEGDLFEFGPPPADQASQNGFAGMNLEGPYLKQNETSNMQDIHRNTQEVQGYPTAAAQGIGYGVFGSQQLPYEGSRGQIQQTGSQGSYTNYAYSNPAGHNRTNTSYSFNEGEGIMGSGPGPTQYLGHPPHNVNSAVPTMPQVLEKKQRAKEAEDLARDAEETMRQISAQVNELRRVADEAEKTAREVASVSEGKKKGFMGRGKKKEMKNAEKVAHDAVEKKNQLLQAESQLKDAEAVALDTRREADRLRREAEDIEMSAATAASQAGSQGW